MECLTLSGKSFPGRLVIDLDLWKCVEVDSENLAALQPFGGNNCIGNAHGEIVADAKRRERELA